MTGTIAQPHGQLLTEDELIRRREARARRRALRQEAAASETASVPGHAEPGSAANASFEEEGAATRETRRQRLRPRAPRAERNAARASSPNTDSSLVADGAGAESAESTGSSLPLPDSLPVVDAKGKSGARVAARARKRQQAAALAVDNTDDNPALGALNRHLNMMMQQLATAHRVIGRVASEREALRQQLADLQGIPVEEIVVSTIGAASEVATRSSSGAASEGESRFAKLNYFGGEDVQVMRRRRQTFVLILAMIGGVLAVIGRQLGWSPPTDFSRDSLAALPILGNLMSVFLAGWVLYRVLRVGGKGVRWIFPTEDRRRRRR